MVSRTLTTFQMANVFMTGNTSAARLQTSFSTDEERVGVRDFLLYRSGTSAEAQLTYGEFMSVPRGNARRASPYIASMARSHTSLVGPPAGDRTLATEQLAKVTKAFGAVRSVRLLSPERSNGEQDKQLLAVCQDAAVSPNSRTQIFRPFALGVCMG